MAAVIPDLGVFVFLDAIYLDYRMGPAQLCALFELLNQLKLLDKAAVVTLPEECLIHVIERVSVLPWYSVSGAVQMKHRRIFTKSL